MVRAAQKIAAIYPSAILLKGGHLGGGANDLLYENGACHWFWGAHRHKKYSRHRLHAFQRHCLQPGGGTEPKKSVQNGKEYVAGALRDGLVLGSGNGPLNHCYAQRPGFPGWKARFDNSSVCSYTSFYRGEKMIDLLRAEKWNALKFGLVLAGGGAKGSYQAGVLSVLFELDIADKISAVSGTSVGALNTLSIALGRKELCPEVWESIGFKDVLVRNERKTAPRCGHFCASFPTRTSSFRILTRCSLTPLGRAKHIYPAGIAGHARARAGFCRAARLRKGALCLRIRHRRRTAGVFSLKRADKRGSYFRDAGLLRRPLRLSPGAAAGRAYADGGINARSYAAQNADNTPLSPLLQHHLDAILVVHLRPDAPDCDAPTDGPKVINLRPSASLEPVRGTGSLNFSRSAIDAHMRLGREDALGFLSPMVFFLSFRRNPRLKNHILSV